MTDDLISRRKAIDALMDAMNDVGVLDAEDINTVFRMLPPAQPNITHIIMETLAECGIYGEEATIKLIGTLKRIGMDDLLLPCAR